MTARAPSLTGSTIPVGGLFELFGSLVLLSSAWPLTRIALMAGVAFAAWPGRGTA